VDRAKGRAALGFSVHTGWAAVVAVGGARDAPEILAKARIDVATTFDEGAVFHKGQELSLAAAAALVRDGELRFTATARTELAALVARLGVQVAGACIVAAAPKPLPPLDAILKSHALVHAAEGELYRRVFAEACTALAAGPARVPGDALSRAVADAARLAPARVAAHLAAMGKASGRPWAADQKRAALAAWLAHARGGRR
jgi:hypothetical protein